MNLGMVNNIYFFNTIYSFFDIFCDKRRVISSSAKTFHLREGFKKKKVKLGLLAEVRAGGRLRGG